MDKTPFQSKSPGDQALAKEILLDAQKMGQTFERLLGQLSSDERPEAQALMQQALEKMDVLNNSLELHKEASTNVWPHQLIHGHSQCPSPVAARATPNVSHWAMPCCGALMLVGSVNVTELDYTLFATANLG